MKKPKRRNLGRPKEIEEGKRVSVFISIPLYEAIASAARQQSTNERKNITFSEVVRRGLETCFPINYTLDMFKD